MACPAVLNAQGSGQHKPCHRPRPQRTLEGGGAAKALLDAVLDAAAAMQNLREAIAGYRGRLMQESGEDKRNALLQARAPARAPAPPLACAPPRRVPSRSLHPRTVTDRAAVLGRRCSRNGTACYQTATRGRTPPDASPLCPPASTHPFASAVPSGAQA